ncbi:ribbon-helix-helix protein, CopG family [Blastococcus capsensis]|uniref:ribbon-helix-helix protein, CopG family n=1 Tax=Blastococcus capsensis TaxID=1564163 RepID=UPI0025420291|nr:ribbon-helix-helix protein, CopG family [Blastococcus capsensis]MDK3257119.1 ribbon-helix-helix protein, CopG family [Blastococcus capsensis]
MATNLRLSDAAAKALRQAAAATGRPQQQLIREALDRYLGLEPGESDRARARAAGSVRPGTPFRDVAPTVHLPPGATTRDLLEPDADPR